jgi:hypothetical protein
MSRRSIDALRLNGARLGKVEASKLGVKRRYGSFLRFFLRCHLSAGA